MAAEGKATISLSSTRSGAILNVTKSSMTFNVLLDVSAEEVVYVSTTPRVFTQFGDVVLATPVGATLGPTALLLYNNDTSNTVCVNHSGVCPTNNGPQASYLPPLGGFFAHIGTYAVTMTATGGCCAVTTVACR
jgi:hypothetical protein